MVTVSRATPSDLPAVLDLVGQLLDELSDDPREFSGLEPASIGSALDRAGDRFVAFLARSATGVPIGVATLTEAVAIYAGGAYGIISELMVLPAHRQGGVGPMLLAAVQSYGRSRGWRRIDVTAPPGERWRRTVAFYERHGFVFTGPKLRYALGPG